MTSYILIIGVLVSIIFYELTDLTPGGIIVPGLMVLYISNPVKIIVTLAVAILTYLVVKVISKHSLIFGKRRFALMILISFAFFIIINLIASIFTQTFSLSLISIVGYTTAGIIANNMQRQGAIKTTLSLGIVVGVLEIILLIFSSLGL